MNDSGGDYCFDSQGNRHKIGIDEIHKFKKWKSFVKREYDTPKDNYRFMVTGSARLDIY